MSPRNVMELMKRVASLVKLRFPNLTVEETIDFATKIVDQCVIVVEGQE